MGKDEQVAEISEVAWIYLDNLESNENLPIALHLNFANSLVCQTITEDAETFMPSEKIHGMIKEARTFMSTGMEELFEICAGKRPDLLVFFQQDIRNITSRNMSGIKQQIKFVMNCNAHYFDGEYEMLP